MAVRSLAAPEKEKGRDEHTRGNVDTSQHSVVGCVREIVVQPLAVRLARNSPKQVHSRDKSVCLQLDRAARWPSCSSILLMAISWPSCTSILLFALTSALTLERPRPSQPHGSQLQQRFSTGDRSCGHSALQARLLPPQGPRYTAGGVSGREDRPYRDGQVGQRDRGLGLDRPQPAQVGRAELLGRHGQHAPALMALRHARRRDSVCAAVCTARRKVQGTDVRAIHPPPPYLPICSALRRHVSFLSPSPLLFSSRHWSGRLLGYTSPLERVGPAALCLRPDRS